MGLHLLKIWMKCPTWQAQEDVGGVKEKSQIKTQEPPLVMPCLNFLFVLFNFGLEWALA